MSLHEQSLPYIRAVSPYQPGKPITQLAREMGLAVDQIVKLASNENPLGMSPKARAAAVEAMASLARYPDDFALKQALSERTGLGMERIVLGNGSNDVLDLIARVFLAPGRSAIFAQYAFAVYPLATLTTGAEGIAVAARDFGHDLQAMRAAIRADTRLIWIANPNNPTGTFLPYPQLKLFVESVPADVVVVLDEAYNEYLPPAERFETTAWLAEMPNLALDDHQFVAASYALNRAGMEQIVGGLKRLGCTHIPSHGNFVTFRVIDASLVNPSLLKQGVIVRPIAAYGMPDWLRVTIGTETENQRFLAALEASL